MSAPGTAELPERGSTLKDFRLRWPLMNAYERFEQVVVLALGLIIARFIDGLQAARAFAELRYGLLDVAFTSIQAMENTISQLRLSAYAPGLTVEIPRNAYGFFEFWRAEELIELGRERTAQAFARIER